MVEDRWLRTGDIAYFDEDGYLFIVDRIKEIIKYKGFQIAPADLEAVLVSHPSIIDAAVTAAPNEECGEIPVAFIVRRQGTTLSEQDVISYVAAQVLLPHSLSVYVYLSLWISLVMLIIVPVRTEPV